MRIKAIIMLSSMVVAGMMVTIPNLGGDTNSAELEAIVNDYMLAFVRATFCRSSKTVLIDELVANDVAPKKHTVHHYLNARFNKIVNSGELALK
jgi:hypothetical protein